MYLFMINYVINTHTDQKIRIFIRLIIVLCIPLNLSAQNYFVSPNKDLEIPLLEILSDTNFNVVNEVEDADYIIKIYVKKSWSKKSKGRLIGHAKGGVLIIDKATNAVVIETDLVKAENTIISGLSEVKLLLAKKIADQYLLNIIDSLENQANY